MLRILLAAAFLGQIVGLYSISANALELDDGFLLSESTTPSAATQQIVVKNYFPQSAPGMVRINEFANPYGTVVMSQFYYQDTSSNNYLVDNKLNLTTGQMEFYDAWVYHVDPQTGEVLETADNMLAYVFDQHLAPLNHGNQFNVGGHKRSISWMAVYNYANSWLGNLENFYDIWMLKKIAQVRMGGLILSDVAAQEEQQYVVCVAYCLGLQPQWSALYRYYFAPKLDPHLNPGVSLSDPALGIVAMQWLKADGSPDSFVMLSKTCYVPFSSAVQQTRRCP